MEAIECEVRKIENKKKDSEKGEKIIFGAQTEILIQIEERTLCSP